MQTCSSSKFVGEPSMNPRHHNRRRSKQRVEPFALEEVPIVTMADQRTMAELLRAPTEGYAEAIVVPPIPAEHFKVKHSLIYLVTSKQFFGFEDPHAHIRYFNKITSTLKYKDVPEASIKLMLFPFSINGPARIWLDKEPPHSILTWDYLVSKFINHFFPPSKTTNLRNEISNFNQKFEETFNSLNSAADGNLLERSAQDVLKIIENKSKVRNSRNKPIVSQVKTSNIDSSEIANAVASAVTSAMTAMFKQHQNQGNTEYRPPSVANQTRPPGFAQPYEQNNQNWYNQGYNQNRGNSSYQAPTQQTQVTTLSELEKFKKTNEASMQAMRNHIGNLKSELRNEMQATMSNQTNELKNMMASFFQMNTASFLGSRPLPSNSIANPKGELKSMTTRSGIVLDGPSVLMPPPFINPEEDERAEETLTDPELVEYTIKVPPPLVQKPQAPSQKFYEMPKRDPLHPNIPYPSRMNKEKQQDKDEIQIHKFWQMFKQLHINISLADALILIPKYQKMLKALLSNKEKLLELANTPLNENCSAVILKKLPEKLGDPGKFLIPCSFSELNCKALADLGASINLMPLSVWKKLGLSELISTRMTLELANRSVCTPAGIARDVFVPVGRFTFPADFVIVDYESDPRVPLILGRPFLRTARALIDVHGEELILRDGDERLILNMKHGTSSYSNKHQRESINMIDIYNISYKDYLEDLEKLLNLDSTKDLPPSPNVNPLSGSTTSSSPSLTTSEISDYSLEEFADELALIESFPPGNDDMTPEDVIREIEYLLNRDPLAENSPNNDLIYTIPEMFTDEHTLDYSSPPRYDDADDDLFYLKTDNDEWGKIFYDDPFDSKENKIKVSKLLVDELDSTGSSSFLPHFLEGDSVLYEDFSEVDTLTSTDNEDKVFNPGILVHENLYEVTNRVTPDKNVKKKSSSNASLILEDYNPPLSDHELPFHIEILGSGTLLSFSSKNEKKVFNLGILISKGVHSLLPELSHRDSKAFKVINIFESPMEIFSYSYGEDIRVLDVLCNGYSLKDKNEAKSNKTEHGNGKSAKSQSQIQ
ncbi:reverse transcriptase domain-containing protein [Tanacetum coccineum]